MGYELAVTPLQLAAAYAAFANGGELVQPALVKEVRDAAGIVRYRHERHVVRRLMSAALADSVRDMLRDVVDGGTAEGASLEAFEVAGKSGTARRVEHGKYVKGAYTASFVGLFPADKPQLVILVKLDNPHHGYYGGKLAAPVFRQVALGAVAARDASLDLSELAGSQRIASNPAPAPRGRMGPGGDSTHAGTVRLAGEVTAMAPAVASGDSLPVPCVVRLGAPRVAVTSLPADRVVPDVRGLPLRRAVLALHEAGFRVSLGDGPSGVTLPAAGAMVRPGSVVRLGAW